MASSEHVYYSITDMENDGLKHEVDIVLGCFYLLFMIIGIPGNVLSCLYFFYGSGKSDLGTLLYRIITITDICCSLFHLPVMISLFSKRSPVLFQSYSVCVGWRMVFKTLQRYSMYLVLLLSVNRTIRIVSPFYIIRKLAVVIAIVLYMLYLVIEEIVFAVIEEFLYSDDEAYCYESSALSTETEIQDVLYSMELGIPSVIVFFSFIVSVVKINQRAVEGESQVMNSRRRATHTIVILTAVSLVLNLPQFLNMTLLNVQQYVIKDEKNLYSGLFMTYYSFNISAVFTVVVNAALDPLVYVWRMKDFRVWLRGLPKLKQQTRLSRRMSSAFYNAAADSNYNPRFPVPTSSRVQQVRSADSNSASSRLDPSDKIPMSPVDDRNKDSTPTPS